MEEKQRKRIWNEILYFYSLNTFTSLNAINVVYVHVTTIKIHECCNNKLVKTRKETETEK